VKNEARLASEREKKKLQVTLDVINRRESTWQCDINTTNMTALAFAVSAVQSAGRKENMRLLLNQGATALERIRKKAK